MAAPLSPRHQKAHEWIRSGSCVVLDNDSLATFRHIRGIDFQTIPEGDRQFIFDPEAMKTFFDKLKWVNVETYEEVKGLNFQNYHETKYVLVAPGLIPDGSLHLDAVLERCTLVAKRVLFNNEGNPKYQIDGESSRQSEFKGIIGGGAPRAFTCLSGVMSTAERTPGIRFIDFA